MSAFIALDRFDAAFDRFCRFVEQRSGHPFRAFADNPYTFLEEGYKAQVHWAGRQALRAGEPAEWTEQYIGSGTLLSRALEAIRVPGNNLVDWRAGSRLEELARDRDRLAAMEGALLALYGGDDDAAAFGDLTGAVGGRYDLIAYLFFLKDATRYAPTRPTYFERAFALIGVDLPMSGRCSWDHYCQYNGLLGRVQHLLEQGLDRVTLLDAHSFLWMLACQMESSEDDSLTARLPKSTRERRYWAAAADPTRYRILDALRDLEWDCWTTKGRDIRRGDRVVIWKTTGRDRWRGVVGFGEVLSEPEIVDATGNPYWVDPADGRPEPMVRIRFENGPGLPIMLKHGDALVENLNVARARGGTVFTCTEQEWEALRARAGAAPVSTDMTPEGQGFASDPKVRRAVELRAMEVVAEHYRRQGATVTDVSARASFDLLATWEGKQRKVEVKGTTGPGASIILTSNEVALARQDPSVMVLAVVSGIEVSYDQGSACGHGGTLSLIEPWAVASDRLEPIAFRYTLGAVHRIDDAH